MFFSRLCLLFVNGIFLFLGGWAFVEAIKLFPSVESASYFAVSAGLIMFCGLFHLILDR